MRNLHERNRIAKEISVLKNKRRNGVRRNLRLLSAYGAFTLYTYFVDLAYKGAKILFSEEAVNAILCPNKLVSAIGFALFVGGGIYIMVLVFKIFNKFVKEVK